MSAVVLDTFTDADATLLTAHAPDVGGTWAKFASGTAAQIASNAVTSSNDAGAVMYNRATPPSPEYDVQAVVDIATDGVVGARFQLVARVQPEPIAAETYYQFFYLASVAPRLRLRKSVGGTVTDLATLDELLGTDPVRVVLQIRDARKAVLVNGVEKLVSTDNAITGAGFSGLVVSSGVTLDNFMVSGASELASPVLLQQSLVSEAPRIILA